MVDIEGVSEAGGKGLDKAESLAEVVSSGTSLAKDLSQVSAVAVQRCTVGNGPATNVVVKNEVGQALTASAVGGVLGAVGNHDARSHALDAIDQVEAGVASEAVKSVGRVHLAVGNPLNVSPIYLVVSGRPVETTTVLVGRILDQTTRDDSGDSADTTGRQRESEFASDASAGRVEFTAVCVG